DHIYYESTLVNNVNIYHVDILPLTVPEVFRSGMSANIDIIVKEKENVLTLPLAAVKSRNGRSFVLTRAAAPDSVRRVPVRLGLQDDNNVEILSGLSASDVVVVTEKAFVLPKDNGGSNPFLPQPRRERQKRGE
ncbi:MAG: efflux RND transporter periplasmic adaptor subunit, partial [Chlorobaculum sp.]|nr:efflux RND transporter periplasmic adaptor subunit [Chlorobaculum sp.]